MKILFLTEQFPYPLHDGGNLRTFHILAGLVQQHDVTLVAHEPQSGMRDVAKFPLNCDVVLAKKSSVVSRVVGGIENWDRSLFLSKNWSENLLAAAEQELRKHSYDVIHFNHLDTACYALQRNWSCKKVFDTHNCLSAMAKQVSANSTKWWQRKVCAAEAQRLSNAEAEVCAHMDKVLVCSEVDARKFQQLYPEVDCEVVPNGVDTDFFQPQCLQEEEATVVFTGAMNYFPNEQAARFFCEQVRPMLKTKNVKTLLVGRRPTPMVEAFHDGVNVVVTGAVDDVRPYVDRAQIFIVPLQHGSGTRLKILEAFAMGKAVVSTSIGAEGIPVTNGREIIIADTADDFAACIDRLLVDPELRRSLGLAAREFVTSRFNWSFIQSDVCTIFTSLKEPIHVG